jgi:hypothetical protein
VCVRIASQIDNNEQRSNHIYGMLLAKALFISTLKPKIFHQMFKRMHEVLNIDENKN